MTEAELLSTKGLGQLSVEEIMRVNTKSVTPDAGAFTETTSEDATINFDPSPDAAMSITNLSDYSEPESYEGRDLVVTALKGTHKAWLTKYAIIFCARRKIEDINYGLALECIVREAMARDPLKEAVEHVANKV